MKIKALATAILLVSANLALAGHMEHDSDEQYSESNDVVAEKTSQTENIQQRSTEASDIAIPDQHYSKDPYEVFEIYRDLGTDLGS